MSPKSADSFRFALARYTDDGRLDPSFGTDGKVLTDFSLRQTADGVYISCIAIDAFGRIVVAGTAQDDKQHGQFALARYTNDGRLDPSFGTGGKILTDFSGQSATEVLAHSIAIDAFGRIVVAGREGPHENRVFRLALARYHTDGQLNFSFGTGGKVFSKDFPSTPSEDSLTKGELGYARAMSVDGFGRIVVTGGSRPDDEKPMHFDLARFHADGTLDPTFGTFGKVQTDFSSSSGVEAWDVALDGFGRILAAGEARGTEGIAIALARYDPHGWLDPSFGTEGQVLTDLYPSPWKDNPSYALTVDGFGRILVAATAIDKKRHQFALARYEDNGDLDRSFGTHGKVLTNPAGSSTNWAYTLAIDPSSRIVTTGTIIVDKGRRQFALVRYNDNGTLDHSFGNKGEVHTNFSADSTDQARAMIIDGFGRILVGGDSGPFRS